MNPRRLAATTVVCLLIAVGGAWGQVPTVASIFPASGPTSGGTHMTILGTHFVVGATAVTVGGAAASSVVVASTTQLSAVTPPGTAGVQDVVVTTPGGSSRGGSFTYVDGMWIQVPPDPATPVDVTMAAGATTVHLTLYGVTASGTLMMSSLPVPAAPAWWVGWQRPFGFMVQDLAYASARVCVPYTDAEVATAGVAEERLVLLQQAGEWIDITSSHDPVSNVVCGLTANPTFIVLSGVPPATTGLETRYLAEGATSAFFDARLALFNPHPTETAAVLLTFLRRDGTSRVRHVHVPARGRRTVVVKDVPEMAVAEFATVASSDLPVVVDRLMSWDASGYGSHAETSLASPALRWYLAEGATHSGFNLFYLLQNADPAREADVRVTYLRAAGPPLELRYTVAPATRFNIWVNREEFPAGSGRQLLAAAEVSAIVDVLNEVPIIVERAMYLDRGNQMFTAGHESAGVTQPATQWFLAEGATGAYFDLFILVANPGPQEAPVTATYLLPDGATVTKAHTIPANSRFTIWVDLEDPLLANTPVSTTITSTSGIPLIVERAMWWPGPTAATWTEAHNSAGATQAGLRWALAEGEQGGSREVETYVLVANTSPWRGTALVTLFYEDGRAVATTIDLPPNSRTNVSVSAVFPRAAGHRFAVLVESTGTAPAELVVERAMYSSVGTAHWLSGSNALGTLLPADR